VTAIASAAADGGFGAAEGDEIVYEAPAGSFRYVVVGFTPHAG